MNELFLTACVKTIMHQGFLPEGNNMSMMKMIEDIF